MYDFETLKALLNKQVSVYYHNGFIPDDPLSIPHSFSKQQDIEIAGFFASILAWGNRKSIITNCRKLMQLMDDSPHDFVLHHSDADLKKMLGFVHRTFNDTDLLYFIYFLNKHYTQHTSLEDAFFPQVTYQAEDTGPALMHFYNYFFTPEHPVRTHKHIANPAKNSACKRLNMYLRWMVRPSDRGVDFGLWHKIKPAQLVCPFDIHVSRNAKSLGLIDDDAANWKNALTLTQRLREFNPNDPVIYDFALFGMGVGSK